MLRLFLAGHVENPRTHRRRGEINCIRCRLLGLNSWNHRCKCVYQGSNVQLHSAALCLLPSLKGSMVLSRWETNDEVLLYCITSLSPLIPDGAGSNSGVTLYAVEPGHMWLSKKADGGTILGREEIPKPALCWLGCQPGCDIYTEWRVNVRRHMSRHLRRREQPVTDTHLGHHVMSPNKQNHYYHHHL